MTTSVRLPTQAPPASIAAARVRKSKRTPIPASTATDAHPSPALDVLVHTHATTPRLVQIPIDLLHDHPSNPRRTVGDVTELAADIAANGIDQALVVVPNIDTVDHPDDPAGYWVVIGHRRRAASILAGLTTVTCRVRTDLTPAQQRQMMVRENIHRQDLTAVEEADAYQAMLDIDGLDVAGIVAAVSRSETTVRSRLRLAALSEPVRAAVHAHTVTLDEAQAIGALDEAAQRDVAKTIGTPNLAAALFKARQAAELAAKSRPLLEVLEAAGATQLKKDTWAAPDGSVHVTSVSVNYLSDEEIAEQTAELVPQLASGWSWCWSYSDIRVYRPFTLEEAQEAAERDARHAQEDAERAAAVAARAEAKAIAAQFAEITAATRAEFLQGALARKIAAPAVAAIAGFAGTYLTADPWHRYDVEPGRLALWTSATKPDGFDDLAAYERSGAWAGPVLTAAAALAAPNRLLAGLAAAMEPISADRWSNLRPPALLLSVVTHWYALLEELGYVVSDVERAALTAPADPGEVS